MKETLDEDSKKAVRCNESPFLFLLSSSYIVVFMSILNRCLMTIENTKLFLFRQLLEQMFYCCFQLSILTFQARSRFIIN